MPIQYALSSASRPSQVEEVPPSGQELAASRRPFLARRDRLDGDGGRPAAAAATRQIGSVPRAVEEDDALGTPRPSEPLGASQIFCGGPPVTSTFFSLPSAKNARNRLSGDQNGRVAPSVPASGLRRRARSSGRTQIAACPSRRSRRTRACARRARCAARRSSTSSAGGTISKRTTWRRRRRAAHEPDASAAPRRRPRPPRAPTRAARGSCAARATGAGTPACEPPSAIHCELQLHVVRRLDSGPRGPSPGTSGRRGRAPAASSARSLEIGGGSSRHDRGDQARLALARERLLARSPSRRARAEREDVACARRPRRPRAARAPCTGTCRGSCPRCGERLAPAPRRQRASAETRPRRRRAACLRQAEVEQLDARLRQHHVAGLEVPVDDPLPVRLVERVGDLDRRSAAPASIGQRPLREALRPASRPRGAPSPGSRCSPSRPTS